jgi:DNA-binding MarR family transcriptional regulator
MDAPTASGLLERLGRDGWIASIPNPDDGRSRIVVLTAKAGYALPKVLQSADDVSEEALACLAPDEALALEQLLSRLCEHGAGSLGREGSR